MKVHSIAASALQADVFTAVLLTLEGTASASQYLPAHIAAAVQAGGEAWAAKDATNVYHTGADKFVFLGLGSADKVTAEQLRKAVTGVVKRANTLKADTMQLVMPGAGSINDASLAYAALAEAVVLANYQFLVYKTEPKANSLTKADIVVDGAEFEKAVKFAARTAKAVNIARDLVNEPPNTLTAEELAARAEKLAKEYGIKAEVLGKKKIESLKMGGLLAVNRGSKTPPTFTILEYSPKGARNSKPIVLVGKGIIFDTGGLSLKPTPQSMDYMKSDMAGAAAVIGAMVALAHNEVPVHVVGLIPSTDNRPGEDAYTPNDVITMMSGKTVEVLNTDAEGRMILADALHYAKNYDPALVIDLATLTGAAVVAVGEIATALMATAGDSVKEALRASGQRTHERLVELPLWDEYADQLKSDVADMKNVGGRYAGSITAGKFLEVFTSYPWVHLDIAGPSFLSAEDAYRPRGGTGVGVRLLTDFITRYTE